MFRLYRYYLTPLVAVCLLSSIHNKAREKGVIIFGEAMELTDEQWKDKFWKCVEIKEQGECWEWMFARHRFGYGWFTYKGQLMNSHRVAYLLFYGSIPKGMCVLHRCDNAPCCNPTHLFLGTKGDNNRDRARKGRSTHVYPNKPAPKGELNPFAKLNDDAVREIRRLYNEGNMKSKDIALMFNINRHTVVKVAKKEVWKHVV